VGLGGRVFNVTRQFIRDIGQHRLEDRLKDLRKALLVFHSPQDEVVGIENASQIFQHAKHPKSFITLHGADHLLTRASDAAYVAEVMAAAVDRYLLPLVKEEAPAPSDAKTVIVSETGFGKFQQVASVSGHRLYVDEPVAVGGMGAGGTPYDLMLAGLGACTSMTLRLYADSKGWPLKRTEVRLQHDRVHADDCANSDQPGSKIDRITRVVSLEGPLTDEQRRRLLEIAEKCPVHRTMTEGAKVETTLAPAVGG
jgi:putative redox protein